jgi:hypothetical protein
VKYFLRTVVGLTLLLGGATYLAYDIYQLLQIGTCASGGPYQVARECPDGTAALGFSIPVAVIVMIVGTGFYGTRGLPPGSEGGGYRVNAIILLWCSIFLGIAFASLWGVWGPDANPGPGGKEGGLIVGSLFVLMGGAALPFLASREESKMEREAAMQRILGKAGTRLASMEPAAASRARPPSAGTGDVVSKLERAQRLRDEGALTEAEFQKLKREILA